jgi:hypothetical protein
LQILIGEDKKSMSGDYFFLLAISIPHKFDLALHASSMMLLPYSMLLLKKKKIVGEIVGNFIPFLGMSDGCMYFYLIYQFIVH